MKKQTLFGLLASAVATVMMLVPATSFAAGSAYFTLSPSSGSYAINSTFSAAIYFEANGEPVNTVTAKLSYDHSKLQLVNFTADGSAFDQGLSFGDSVTRYMSPGAPTVSNGKVANANFKVLVDAGSVAVGFAAGSQVGRANPGSSSTDIWDPSNTAGGTYTLTPAPVAPAPAPVAQNPAPSNTKTTQTPAAAAPATADPSKPETLAADDKKADDAPKSHEAAPAARKEGMSMWYYLIVALAAIAAGLYTRRQIMERKAQEAAAAKPAQRKQRTSTKKKK